ncbi:Outer membrane receptor for ferrienterochelin and colicins [Marivirga sericea]|uniref:Outer membrane receptor for ferrienterochelin and colicins n=1 Tax=Marivirga sericea TaxID=1028 RepID=A0A1X7ICD9_9BACT|nr:TonB-dependent receptor [Marivirga sericea]SMG12190.1 Outer membrane receptor for ferrienterochelin and colicins [Marivirga sericea]
MKYSILLLTLLFSTNLTLAQQRGGYGGGANSQITGKITGTIVDGQSSEAVSYATVVIKSPKDGKTVNGVVTGDDGSFKLVGLKLGTYIVEVSFVGFQKFTQEVELTPKEPDFDFEKIELAADTDQLDEVVVSGKRETIENKIDRIVYNADQDVANMGGDASDVLRRAPLLSVDQNGNVSLRGNSNVQILINGKPSSMFGANTGDALKMIPSDQIKSVEVITSPSAKYDGEGTAGIINIITKKQTPQGFAGNVDLTAGTRINRGVVGINAGKGRLGFNANGSSFYSWPQFATTDFFQQTVVNGQTNTREQNGENLSNRLGYFGNMGAFYDFNAYHSLSTSLRLRGFNSNSTGTNTVTQNLAGDESSYQRFQDNFSQNWGYEWSLDYVMKFPEQEGREFSASYKIDGNVRDQEFEINQPDPANYEVGRNVNDGNNRENTVQLDYTHPMGESFKLETGFKSIIRDIDSDFRFEEKPEGASSYQVVDNRTDVFFYNQDVFAGYISTQTNITKKLGVIAGVRYEYTGLDGTFEEATEQAFGPISYENWLPSIIVNQKFGKFNSVKLAYNRRIQRPSLGNVNPYVEIGNIRNISFGNPMLNPELSDNYELGFSTFLKGTSLNLSFFYNDISEVIQSVIFEDPERNATVTTFENVGTQQNMGSNIFISTELFKIWTVRGGLNANYFMAEGIIQGQEVENNAWLFSGNISSNLELPNDWVIDAFGFARPRRQTLQGYNPAFSIFGMGIKKQIWDKRGSIGLSIIEPFKARKPFKTELGDENSDFYQRNVFAIPFRSFGINFSYKFGQLDYKARQKRSRISNDDQKSGGDDGQSF